ncbi:MAG: CpaF/VirB11 family protein [Lachnospiraceae bacterium]|nr:CpaF/VirB11 family protein [Lachnospiraceae bacterium]
MAELYNRDVLDSDFFGPLWPYIKDVQVTDIDYNGRVIWITSINHPRYFVKPDRIGMKKIFVEQFSGRIANCVSKQFNRANPVLEASTETLRITIIHESVAKSGRTFCIRKSPPTLRYTREAAVAEGYCSDEAMDYLIDSVKKKKNFVICGEPGSGKTEFAKFLSQFIDISDRVVTIEDTREWHYGTINPGADFVELTVGNVFTYSDALKTCMRLNPGWIMLSEARSTEAKYLIEDWSSGVKGITTIHTDDVRKIPDRILNMIGDIRDATRLVNSVYEYVDVGILIKKHVDSNGRQYRKIEQIAYFSRESGCNRTTMIYSSEDGDIKTQFVAEEPYEEICKCL